MEFSLIPLQAIKFGHRSTGNSGTTRPLMATTIAKVDVRPLAGTLEKLWLQNCHCRKGLDSEELNVNISVFHHVPSTHPGRIVIKTKVSEDSIFTRLKTACGGLDKFTVDLEIELGTRKEMQHIEAHRLKIQQFTDSNGELEIGFEEVFLFTKTLQQEWKKTTPFVGTISVRMRVPNEEFANKSVSDLQNINKRLLMDTSLADAVIVAENGVEVKCHKFFLSAQSPVFKVMLESKLTEGLTGVIKLSDISEPGVRAILHYLYCCEICPEAENSCETCLELLLAADRYDIPKLANAAQELILWKGHTWFTFPIAIQFWLFAKTKGDGDLGNNGNFNKRIMTKCVNVLRLKPTAELQSCPEFQEILSKNSSAAMELCMHIMK